MFNGICIPSRYISFSSYVNIQLNGCSLWFEREYLFDLLLNLSNDHSHSSLARSKRSFIRFNVATSVFSVCHIFVLLENSILINLVKLIQST